MLQTEDQLLDWNRPLCLNFTPLPILERLQTFYTPLLGTMDTVCGDIYIAHAPEDGDAHPDSVLAERPE